MLPFTNKSILITGAAGFIGANLARGLLSSEDGITVVGFDNLKANMDALRSGTVSVLIGQRPDEQVRLAIETLAEYAIRGKRPQKKDHFMHMDILTPFNVEDY